MLVRGVVEDQVDDHPHPAVAGGADHLDEVAERAQPRVDAVVVGDVVAVVAVGGREERHQPQAGDAQVGEVVHPLGEPLEVAHAVAVPVHEGLHVQAVDDGRLPPQVTGLGDPHAGGLSARAGQARGQSGADDPGRRGSTPVVPRRPGLRGPWRRPVVEVAVRAEVVAALAVQRLPQVVGLVGVPRFGRSAGTSPRCERGSGRAGPAPRRWRAASRRSSPPTQYSRRCGCSAAQTIAAGGDLRLVDRRHGLGAVRQPRPDPGELRGVEGRQLDHGHVHVAPVVEQLGAQRLVEALDGVLGRRSTPTAAGSPGRRASSRPGRSCPGRVAASAAARTGCR